MTPHASIAAPICPYCGATSVFRDASVVYQGRTDLGWVWLCPNYPACDSYVGCHRADGKPLGRLANKELRRAKNAAHAAFDKLWKAKMRKGSSKGSARGKAYRWLSQQMRLPAEKTHIGMFDVEQCLRVVAICSPHVARLRS